MDEQKSKKSYKTEWSFSFDKIGDSINNLLGSVKISDEEVKTKQINEPLAGATEAFIRLGLSVGTVTVKASDKPGTLFEADLTYLGELDYKASGDSSKTIELKHKQAEGVSLQPVKDALHRFVNREDLRWLIGISPEVPVKLKLSGGVGKTLIDLSGLKLGGVELDGGVGEVQLTLPAAKDSYVAEIDGGVGGMHVSIADGAALKLKIDGGVGGVSVHLPEKAAARVEIDGGLGGVDLPKRFKKVKGGDDFITKSGVWETEGYALAAQQIYIHFDGGVGGFKVS
jgi:hypothetical protein